MQFIDLDRQYERIEKQIRENIDRVLCHKQFIMGKEVEELENSLADYTGRRYVFTCSSGTDALVIPLMAYELHQEDVVFVPSFTFYASAESVNLAGGTPIFVDSDETYNMSPTDLEEKICLVLEEGKYTPRGIIAVDLFGVPADYKEIQRIADKYGLFVIEDAAQSFGAVRNGIKAGKFGDVSATSFFPAKPLGCYGDGGAIFTDNEVLAKKIYSIRVHGQGENKYDNVRIGMNGRLDTLQAAVLLAKLTVFEEEIQLRQKVAERYTRHLGHDFKVPIIPEGVTSVWAQYSLLTESEKVRNKIIESLKEKEIPIMIYYPIPLHKQKAYQKQNKELSLQVCEMYGNCIFSVPMYPYLKEGEIDYICDSLLNAI